MLDDYRPIMLNGAHLVALYAVAYISAPLRPSSHLEYLMLAMASAWLCYAMYLMQQERRRPSSLFFIGCALMPWCFYGELYYIETHRDGISDEVFNANLAHAVFIYQSFKYVFLACAAGAALKGMYQAIRKFGSSI